MRLVDNAILYDHIGFQWCQQLRWKQHLIQLSRQISRSADGYLYVIFGVFLFIQQNYGLLKVGIVAFIVERSAYFCLKKSTRRNRPPDALPNFQSIIQASDKFSFPSGHTSAAFLMSALVTTLYAPAAWLLYPWACSVGFSRVMLGVHFPTDTLAGAVLGSSIALSTIALFV